MVQLGAIAKCAPPLRSREDQADLWHHLFAGNIQFIASDHSPAPPEMKTGEDFFKIWGGISGCQTLLQSLLTEGYERRDLPLETIAALTSMQPAQRFGLAPGKGSLAIDADADLALVDLNRHKVLRAQDLYYRHQQSPFVGRTLRGEIVCTLVRGRTIFQAGQPVSSPNGRLISLSRRSV